MLVLSIWDSFGFLVHLIDYIKTLLSYYHKTGRSSPLSYYLCGVSHLLTRRLAVNHCWDSDRVRTNNLAVPSRTLAQSHTLWYLFGPGHNMVVMKTV